MLSSLVRTTAVILTSCISTLVAATPEVTNIPFDRTIETIGQPNGLALPEWITKVEQQEGTFLPDPKCWHVPANSPQGVGRLSVSIDREKVKTDLAATVLFDAGDTADIAVQLLDAQDRVIEVDLFGSLVDVGREATTDTFIVPLRKYPTAQKVVLRRITGDVKLYGMALFPVVTQGEAIPEAMQELAKVLCDPLSPDNPLVKALESIAKNGQVALTDRAAQRAKPLPPPKPEQFKYPAAQAQKPSLVPPVPTRGLVAHWTFDGAVNAEAEGRLPMGRLKGEPVTEDGIFGTALQLKGAKQEAIVVQPKATLDLTNEATVAGWVKYSSIAKTWGSQILWQGDRQLGSDPLVLHLLPDGRLEFRSDRSITGGKAKFVVFDDEIRVTKSGEVTQSQHVAVQSPGVLEANQWYFVSGTLEKISPRIRAMTLYINGEKVSQLHTEETVNYPIDRMWLTIGAVDAGGWQHFDGAIDDLRLYNRALKPEEVKALYQQPWK